MTGVHYCNENVKNFVCKNIYKVIYKIRMMKRVPTLIYMILCKVLFHKEINLHVLEACYVIFFSSVFFLQGSLMICTHHRASIVAVSA